MLPTMYQGFALVLCLIPNFFPFANQTLSIARNNPPDGEQIEYEHSIIDVATMVLEECGGVRTYALAASWLCEEARHVLMPLMLTT
jgi:hypothetical protein